MPPLLVRDGVRRDGFLATLGSRTWRPRACSAATLADVAALSSTAAYAAWLRRVAEGWSRLPGALPAGSAWPLVSIGPEAFAGRAELAADLADLTGAPAEAAAREAGAVDEAFLVGAAYVAVVAAGDAAVLADGAAELADREGFGAATRFLDRCRDVARARSGLRRELAAWAADREPQACERAVLTARTLTRELAEALRG